MSITSAQGMVDILPPAPPVDSLSPTLVLFSIFIFLLAGALVIWFQRKPRPALRRLRRLLNKQSLSNTQRREAAFMLADELRQSLKIKHLAATHPPSRFNPTSDLDLNSWAELTQRLHAARFSVKDVDKTTLNKLILESSGWVKHCGK